MYGKSLLKVLLICLFLSVSSLFMVSCLKNGNNPPVPHPVYTLDELVQGAYRGGYMIHSENDGINQIVTGMTIPLRLEYIPLAARRVQDDDYVAEVMYGYMQIGDISENAEGNGKSIVFDYLFYDAEGEIAHFGNDARLDSASDELCSIDFNEDGFPDSFFKFYDSVSSPLTEGRRDIGSSAYFLKFSDPRENGNSCGYRIISEMYDSGELPSGLLGINPDGRYISTSKNFELYDEITPTATTVAFYSASMPNLRIGDFIIDTQNERFREIVAILERTDDYTLFESTDTTADKAFIVFDLDYLQPVQVSIDRSLLDRTEKWEHDFDETLWEKTVDTAHGEFKQTLEATGNVIITVDLSASMHAGIHWKWHVIPEIELKCNVGIKFDFDHSFFLEYKAVEDYAREWVKQLFEAKVTIDVEGVPITLSADGKIGLVITGNAEADFWTGYRFTADMEAGVGYELGDGFNHYFHHSMDFTKYGPKLEMKGTLDIKPYFELDLGLTVAYIATVQSNTKPYVEGVCNGNAGVYMDDDYRAKAEDMWIDLDLYGGLEQDITLKLGYKSVSVHKTYTLYDHKWKIWDVYFKWPQAPDNFRKTDEYKQTVFNWDDKSAVETGYRIYYKPYQANDWQEAVTESANAETFTFEQNLDALFLCKAYYHVDVLDRDFYQLINPPELQVIACPEELKAITDNGNLRLIWYDVSKMNTKTEIFAKGPDDADYVLIGEVDGDAADFAYGRTTDHLDTQFKARAVYDDGTKGIHYSAYSDVYTLKPAAPQNFTGETKSGDALLDLRWDDVSQINNHTEIYVKKLGETDYTLFATVDGETDELLTIPFAEAGPGSRFKAKAVYENPVGRKFYSDDSDEFEWTLSAPDNLTVTVLDHGSQYARCRLNWDNHSLIATYVQVWYKGSKRAGPATVLVGGTETETVLQFGIDVNIFDPDYSVFKVRAVYEDALGIKYYSDYSKEVEQRWLY